MIYNEMVYIGKDLEDLKFEDIVKVTQKFDALECEVIKRGSTKSHRVFLSDLKAPTLIAWIANSGYSHNQNGDVIFTRYPDKPKLGDWIRAKWLDEVQ